MLSSIVRHPEIRNHFLRSSVSGVYVPNQEQWELTYIVFPTSTSECLRNLVFARDVSGSIVEPHGGDISIQSRDLQLN